MIVDKQELSKLVAASICADQDFKDDVRENVMKELSRKQDEAIRIAIIQYVDGAVAKVTDYIKTAKYPRTNQWGERQGSDMLTLAEWVDAEIKRMAGDTYSNKSLLSVMQKAVAEQIKKQIDALFDEQKAAIRQGIADIVAKRIVDHGTAKT